MSWYGFPLGNVPDMVVVLYRRKTGYVPLAVGATEMPVLMEELKVTRPFW